MNADVREYAPAGVAPPERALPLLVHPELALFPGVVQRLAVTGPEGRALVESLANGAAPLLVLALEDPEARGSRPAGILARVLKTMGHASGNHGLEVEGLERVELAAPAREGRFRTVRARPAGPQTPGLVDAELFARLRALAKEAIGHMPELGSEAAALVDAVPDAGRLADLAGANLDFAASERAALLGAADASERVRLVVSLLERKLERLRRESAELGSQTMKQPWVLEPGAAERIRRLRDAGTITAEEAAHLTEFGEKGYTIWPGLIPHAEIDRLLADIESIREHPGHFVTTDHRHGLPYRYSDADFDAYESIFDLYVNFESAGRLCFHPTILRFLELLFEARPVAFQQLLFQRSNQHQLHQDTAYVCVDQPLLMAATWIALEDVVQGRGELTYFEGSHRIPHFFFRDGSKRFGYGKDDPAPVARHMQEHVRALGCRKHDFLAKKGDVFLWAADLVHGSNPRTRPDHETRRACVTHYCPETTRPFWFRVFKGHRGFQDWGKSARIASCYYALPKGPLIVRPSFLLPQRPPG